MRNKIVGIGLASCILLSGVAFAADDKLSDNENKTTIIKEVINVGVKDSRYIEYQGTIKEVYSDEFGSCITVKSEKEGLEDIKFNISDSVVLLNDKNMDFVKFNNLKEGMKVSVYYGENEPMTMSLPPMTNPTAIVIRESEELCPVKLSKFNEELVSIDNQLKLNITEDTKIVDILGNKLGKEDIYNKNSIVFYGPSETRSIPAQSVANKIIVLNPKVNVLDKLVIDNSEKILKNEMFKSKGFTMLPLRELAEGLDYKVSWDKESKSAVLKKGTPEIKLVPGKDEYSFSKSIVRLGKESEVINGNTYVPLDFVEKVLKLNLNVTEDGIINISQK